jgi:hypothetical protein
MRISRAVFIVAIFSSPSVVCAVQLPSNAAPTQGAPPAPVAPSGLLQPSLDALQQTMGALRLEKWKRGTIREEAGANTNSILVDLQATLPPLLHDADAAPGAVSNVLPVSRNIDALYDTLLRVVEAARVSAPGDQVTQLQQALINLGNARRALEDRLQEAAAAQEKQLSDLRSTLRAQSSAKCPVTPAPVTPACVPKTPPRKAKKKPKPPATPPQTQPSPPTGTPKAENEPSRIRQSWETAFC